MYETYYDNYNHILENFIQRHHVESVTKGTPKTLKVNESVKIMRFDEIFNEEDWYKDEKIKTHWSHKKCVDFIGMQVMTSSGWKHFEKLFRHETEKDFFTIRTKHAMVDATEDHSLPNRETETSKPCVLVLAEDLLPNPISFGEIEISFNEVIDRFYNTKRRTLREKEMLIKCFFLGDGALRI